MRAPHVNSGGRYPVLRALAILYVIMAGIALVAGLIGAGWALVAAPWNVGNRVVLALLTLAGAFFLILGSLAVAEVLKLFMDIEHNSRMANLRDVPEAMRNANNVAGSDGGRNRLREMDEETAETALLRGH